MEQIDDQPKWSSSSNMLTMLFYSITDVKAQMAGRTGVNVREEQKTANTEGDEFDVHQAIEGRAMVHT